MAEEIGPPPGAVHELAERMVELVRRSMNLTLDYTAETLPILDHYLAGVPRDRASLVDLVAACAGAYFGEVARRELGGAWDPLGPPETWKLRLTGDVELVPMATAAAAMERPSGDDDAGFEVAADDRPFIEATLADRQVPEEEYYSLSGRLETLNTVVDLIVGRRAGAQAE